eukprot:4929893-Pleurochrysis_carterae.AAC.1
MPLPQSPLHVSIDEHVSRLGELAAHGAHGAKKRVHPRIPWQPREPAVPVDGSRRRHGGGTVPA